MIFDGVKSQLIQAVERNSKKVEQKINDKIREEYAKDLKNMAKRRIDEFYSVSAVYDRPTLRNAGTEDASGGLYDTIDVEARNGQYDTIDVEARNGQGDSGKGIYIILDSDNLQYDPSRRDDISDESGFKEYLFTIIMDKGYHGGADKSKNGDHPDGKTPFYRTPVPYYTHWGYEAKRENSIPFEDISKKAKSPDFEKYQRIAENLYEEYAMELLDL